LILLRKISGIQSPFKSRYEFEWGDAIISEKLGSKHDELSLLLRTKSEKGYMMYSELFQLLLIATTVSTLFVSLFSLWKIKSVLY